jgi:acyl carrier protein
MEVSRWENKNPPTHPFVKGGARGISRHTLFRRGYMNTLEEIKKIIIDLLDLEEDTITPETYLIKELGAESIDLLELAVAIHSRFKISVKDDNIFLTRFRLYLTEAASQEKDMAPYLAGKYPHLSEERIADIIAHISEGPQLKIKDLISYITHHTKG